MSLLATSKAPTKRFTAGSNYNVYTILSPAINTFISFGAICRNVIHVVLLFVFFNTYTLFHILFRQSLYATQILLIQSYYTSIQLSQHLYWTSIKTAYVSQVLLTESCYGLALLCLNLYWVSIKAFWYLWDVTERPRRKVAFEFAVFLLGGGNGLVLLAFWPGWLLVGLGVWLVWCLLSWEMD